MSGGNSRPPKFDLWVFASQAQERHELILTLSSSGADVGSEEKRLSSSLAGGWQKGGEWLHAPRPGEAQDLPKLSSSSAQRGESSRTRVLLA